MEVPTGLEPMMTELQSVALPTWLRNHFIRVINDTKLFLLMQLFFLKSNFFYIIFVLVVNNAIYLILLLLNFIFLVDLF